MHSKFMAATSCLVAALALGVTACGDDGGGESDAPKSGGEAKTVTVYSSLPQQGASRDPVADVVNGIKLSLEQAGRSRQILRVQRTPPHEARIRAAILRTP